MKAHFLFGSSSLILALFLSLVPAVDSQEIIVVPPDGGVIIWPPPDDTLLSSVVTISVTDPLGTEPRLVDPRWDPPEIYDPAIVTVHRFGPTNINLPVFYSLGGMAANGLDYATLSGQVIIPAGAVSADIVIEPLADDLKEGVESVVVRIEPPICIAIYPPPPECYIVGRENIAAVSIRDDGTIPPNLPPGVRIVSPANDAVFKLGATIPVEVITVDPDGYAPHVELYADGIKVAEQTIVFIVAPPDGEPIHFDLEWTGAPAGLHVLTALAIDDMNAPGWSGPVRIFVESSTDVPVVNVVATDPEAAEPDPVPPGMGRPTILDPGVFTVTRTGDTEAPLNVYYTLGGTAGNGVDYDPLPWYVTIPAGAAEALIQVIPIDDLLPEGKETVVLTLVPPPVREPLVVNAMTVIQPVPVPYRVGPNYRAVVTIADNDVTDNLPPRVALVSPADGAVFLAPADIPIFAHAVDLDGQVVQVEFFADMKSIGVVKPDPRVMSPINPFHIVWSDVPAGRYQLTAVATDDDGATSRSEPVYITVTEQEPPPDRPPVVHIVARDPLGSERESFGRTPTLTFLIMRRGNTNNSLTVYYQISGSAINGVDYRAIPNAVTIPAGFHGARIVIQPIDDALSERPETVVLSLRLPPLLTSSAGVLPPYFIGCPAQAAGMILDDDPGRPYCRRLQDGLIHVWQPGEDGGCFRIETSTNLRDWEVLVENTITDGAAHFVDPEGPLFRQRFYRIIAIPCPLP